MKMGLAFSVKYLPWYVLIASCFFGGLVFQYAAFAFFFLAFLFSGAAAIRNNNFFFVTVCFILVAGVSYLYNLALGNGDAYTIVFWFFSYLPPLLLIWILPAYSQRVEFEKLYGFYKKLVYLQSFLLIGSAIKNQKFIVGDLATGTVGDANWVAYHICVVLIYEIVKVVSISRSGAPASGNILRNVLEIAYFFIVFLIPESTANLGLMILIVLLVFFNEYIVRHLNVRRMVVFALIFIASFYIFSGTYMFERLSGAIADLQKKDIDKDPYLAKAAIYKKVFNGEIYSEGNWLIGSGPATFTSRSSVMRMPDERVNDFPVPLPYFKSHLFKKYISPIYAEWRRTRESYGNFASPQTTIISVSVELGLLGIFFFLSIFYLIFSKAKALELPSGQDYLKKFIFYFSVFYVVGLFHLNFWEYSIITFPYLIFTFSILSRKDNGIHKPVNV